MKPWVILQSAWFWPFTLMRVQTRKLCGRLRASFWGWEVRRRGGQISGAFDVKQGASLSLSRNAKVRIGRDVVFAEGSAVFVEPGGELTLGDGVFIGRGAVVACSNYVSIGKGTQIAHYATMIDTDHRFDRTDASLLAQGGDSAAIRIGEDVWIGANAVILKGRTLGDHCVVGAGAIVTKDVPAGMVVVGNPARLLSKHKVTPAS